MSVFMGGSILPKSEIKQVLGVSSGKPEALRAEELW